MKKLIVIANDADACGKTTLTALLSGFVQRKGLRHTLALTSHEQELPLETVMLDADHFVHQEKPDEVNQIILD